MKPLPTAPADELRPGRIAIGEAQHFVGVPPAIRWTQLVTISILVVALPVWAGGVSTSARVFLIFVGTGLIGMEALWRCWHGRSLDRWERAWLLPWLLLSLLALVQLLPLPPLLVRGLGAYPDALRDSGLIALVRISPAPVETASYWATFSVYWAVALGVARLPLRSLRSLAGVLVLLAGFEASYGLWAWTRASETILGLWPRGDHILDATGTFVNRNHYAGLLALCWPLALTWLLSPAHAGGMGGPRPLRRTALLSVSLLLGTAILVSHSRLGLIAAGVGLAVWAVGTTRGSRPVETVPRWIYWAAPAIALAGGLWLSNARLVDRWLSIGEQQDRLLVWTSLLRLPWQTWLLGAGAGSFHDVFKTVQPGTQHNSYRYAHNDWLELLLDFGLVGGILIALVVLRWWREIRPRALSSLQLAAFAGVAVVLVRSLADFDLQIPGTALAFWVFVGIALNREAGAVAERPDGPGPTHRPKTLIVELWGMGDGVIMTSALQTLQPSRRRLWVLCKPHTQRLLESSYPDVRFLPFEAPWTAFRGKYRLWRWPWRRIARVLWLLRRQRFDEAVSVRRDPRDHLWMWLAGAARRCGFPRAGSGILLNSAVEAAPQLRHRVEDWQALTAHLLGEPPGVAAPAIRGLGACRPRPGSEAASRDEVRFVLHCGAGQPVRRWPLAHYAELFSRLRRDHHFELIVIPDADGFGLELRDLADEVLRRPSIEELVRTLGEAAVFVGNDSGPGHLAAALGVPCISIFGPQEPDLFRPFGSHHLAVSGKPCVHRPCSDQCRFPEPTCLTLLSPDEVEPRVRRHLEALIAEGRLPASIRGAHGGGGRPPEA